MGRQALGHFLFPPSKSLWAVMGEEQAAESVAVAGPHRCADPAAKRLAV